VHAVHERWQIDFKLAIPYGSGQYAILITVRDPVGAAFMALEIVAAASKAAHVTEAQVRHTLRQAFAQWGLPDEIQTDGEAVLVGQPQDTFPSRFTLWLTGLGIHHNCIRPGKPTDNAEVERSHRTAYQYALAGSCAPSLEQLQDSVHQACQELNAEYPSRAHGCQHRPPLQAHPELLSPRRPFDATQEGACFSLAQVLTFLATLEWERKVGKTGQISFRGKEERFSVGRAYAGQTVLVRFDPHQVSFVVYDANNQEIARHPAHHLTSDELLSLP